jgi:pimeloyl-ACP methyl ester carboxylesterase
MLSSSRSEADRTYRAAHEALLQTWPVPAETVWVTSPSGRTHLLAAGPPGAPAVFLVPGIGTAGVAWTAQIEALVATHRVYAVDLPGNYGRSEPTRRPRSFDDFARWYVEVLDALGLPRADYVGMSYGGCVGAHLALAVPGRIRRLVLMAPAATLRPLSMGIALQGISMLVWPTRARHAGALRWMAVPPAEGRERYEALIDKVADVIYAGRKRTGISMLPNPRVLGDDELRRLSVPTLVMIGDQEKIYDANAALARAEALIPGVKTVLIPDASHDLMFCQPAAVNAALEAFLAESSALVGGGRH